MASTSRSASSASLALWDSGIEPRGFARVYFRVLWLLTFAHFVLILVIVLRFGVSYIRRDYLLPGALAACALLLVPVVLCLVRVRGIRPGVFLAAIIVLGAAIRLLVVTQLPFTPGADFQVYHESGVYMSQTWSHGEGYRCFFPPGQAFGLAVMYRLFGPNPLAGQMLNVAYAIGTTVAVWHLARTLFNETVARAAALFFVLMPTQVFGCQLLGAEVSGAFWLVSGLAVYAATVKGGRHQIAGLLVAGVLLGIGALIRPTILLVPIPLTIHLFLSQSARRLRALRTGAILTLGTALAVLPWTLRNYHVTGGFILISSNGGGNLWNANNDITEGGYTDSIWVYLFENADNDLELNNIGMAKGKEWIKSHPRRFAWLAGQKFQIFWRNASDIPWWSLDRCGEGVSKEVAQSAIGLSNVVYLLLLLLACLGVLLPRRRLWSDGAWMILPIVAAYFSAVHMVFESQGKYRFVLEPLLCILAGLFVLTLRGGFDKLRRSDPLIRSD